MGFPCSERFNSFQNSISAWEDKSNVSKFKGSSSFCMQTSRQDVQGGGGVQCNFKV